MTQVRSRLLPDLVADHAGFFKVAGDMNAYLYTSSRAMHSDILNLLTGQVRADRRLPAAGSISPPAGSASHLSSRLIAAP